MTAALKQVGRGLSRAWEGLTEGWRELINRSSTALTRFTPKTGRDAEATERRLSRFPTSGLLAGRELAFSGWI